MTEITGPNRPEPKTASLDAAKTAVVVLDLNARCHDPEEVCSQLMEPLGGFLERVREASVPVVFTVSLQFKGTTMGEVAAPPQAPGHRARAPSRRLRQVLRRRPSRPS